MSDPSVVIVGPACVDTNSSEHASYTGWGSSVLYISQYYSHNTSAKPTVISSYGPDMLQYLPPVDLLPKKPNQSATLLYENDTRSGKRTQHCRNADLAGPPAISEEILTVVRNADIVIVATLLPNYPAAYLQKILSAARADSLKVLCPQGYFRNVAEDGLISFREFNEAESILPLFDLVVYSEEDCPDATGLARTWKQYTDAEIIVTRADNGAVIVRRDGDTQVPTTPIPFDQIVDSVGCGDTFAAAAALEYYRSHDLVTAVKAAHKVAADKLKAVIAVR